MRDIDFGIFTDCYALKRSGFYKMWASGPEVNMMTLTFQICRQDPRAQLPSAVWSAPVVGNAHGACRAPQILLPTEKESRDRYHLIPFITSNTLKVTMLHGGNTLIICQCCI